MKIFFLHIAAIFITGSFTACNYFNKAKPEKPNPIARVGNDILYAEDLAYLFKNKPNKQDSITVVKSYIDDWVRKKLLLQTATKYLPEEKQNLEKKIEDYRESLLIYLYEDELLKQKLDTQISIEAIDTFYKAFKQNFRLDDALLQIAYIKMPKDAPKIDSARYLMANSNNKNKKRLESYCFRYAKDFYLKDSLWLSEQTVLNKLPIDIGYLKTLENNGNMGEVGDSSYIYLLKVNDYKAKGEHAPMQYVQKDLRFMLINKRKQELLSNAFNNIYQDAIKNGDFETYK